MSMEIRERLVHAIPDYLYLKRFFRKKMGRNLNLKNPKTFNEKLQWLKLYDRKPEYSKMVDKIGAKEYVSERVGEDIIIPTIGVYESFAEIDFNMLPNQFVMKCSHDSGGLVICKNKSNFDVDSAREKIEKSLKNNYYYSAREWPYKNVKPRILIEKYLQNEDGSNIEDYKLQCINGKVDNIFVCVGRYSSEGVRYHYFDTEWNYIPYCPYEGVDKNNVNIPKPRCLDQMIMIAEKLAEGLPQLRVDLYEIKGKVYFGEMTFYSQAGFDLDITYEADLEMGSKLQLPVGISNRNRLFF